MQVLSYLYKTNFFHKLLPHRFLRLVMRTTGSLRVVLNTKLWPEMICEKVNEKNIRISATDNEHVRSDLMLDCCWQSWGSG